MIVASILVHASILPASEPAQVVCETQFGRVTETALDKSTIVGTHDSPYTSNFLAALMRDSTLLLVDSPNDTLSTALWLDWLIDKFHPLRFAAINTHFHNDRTGGNEVYLERGIPVYGSDLCAELLESRIDPMRVLLLDYVGGDSLWSEYFQNLELAAPDSLFPLKQGLSLQFDDEEVRTIFPGAGHSPDNVVVWLPERNVLFGGCLILAGKRVGNKSDAVMRDWPNSVRSLLPLAPQIVIPGHGKIGDLSLLEHTLDVLQEDSLQNLHKQP